MHMLLPVLHKTLDSNFLTSFSEKWSDLLLTQTRALRSGDGLLFQEPPQIRQRRPISFSVIPRELTQKPHQDVGRHHIVNLPCPRLVMVFAIPCRILLEILWTLMMYLVSPTSPLNVLLCPVPERKTVVFLPDKTLKSLLGKQWGRRLSNKEILL